MSKIKKITTARNKAKRAEAEAIRKAQEAPKKITDFKSDLKIEDLKEEGFKYYLVRPVADDIVSVEKLCKIEKYRNSTGSLLISSHSLFSEEYMGLSAANIEDLDAMLAAGNIVGLAHPLAVEDMARQEVMKKEIEEIQDLYGVERHPETDGNVLRDIRDGINKLVSLLEEEEVLDREALDGPIVVEELKEELGLSSEEPIEDPLANAPVLGASYDPNAPAREESSNKPAVVNQGGLRFNSKEAKNPGRPVFGSNSFQG